MFTTNRLNKLVLEDKEIPVGSNVLYIAPSEVLNVEGLVTINSTDYFFKNMYGVEAIPRMGEVDAVITSSYNRVDVVVMERYTEKSKDNDLFEILEATNGQKILGLQEDLEAKYYGHCENNIYEQGSGLQYCSKGRLEFQTTKCNANCPFYKQQKIMLENNLNAGIYSTPFDIKNLSTENNPTEGLSSFIVRGVIL